MVKVGERTRVDDAYLTDAGAEQHMSRGTPHAARANYDDKSLHFTLL